MKKKIFVLITAFSLAATASIGSTLAWLTAQSGTLVNTFTVGNIQMKLDEAQVSDNSVVDGRTEMGNSYRIYDGAVLPKDPTTTIEAGSEDCYVFMSCVPTDSLNGKVNMDIDTEHWVTADDNLYVYSTNGQDPAVVKYNADTDTKLPELFTKVTVNDNCHFDKNTMTNANITVKALAYQSNGADYNDALAEAKARLN